eukprot:6019623-Heterocapsa_arctica.AAC.1
MIDQIVPRCAVGVANREGNPSGETSYHWASRTRTSPYDVMIDPLNQKFQEVKMRLTRPEHIGQDAVELDAERASAPDRAVELRWGHRTAAN